MSIIKIFIVDDHKMVIEGIAAMLHSEADITVAGWSTDAEGCIGFFKSYNADIILMDISMPGSGGLDLCRQIKTNYPEVAIIALSTFNQGIYVANMMERGASGYLLKNAEKPEILTAIHTVYNGSQYLSFEAAKAYHVSETAKKQIPILTKREKEIVNMIKSGFTNTEIAKRLFISVDTVDTHRKNIYSKLGVKNTAMLINYTNLHDVLS